MQNGFKKDGDDRSPDFFVYIAQKEKTDTKTKEGMDAEF
jgi:hypothetical protein